MEIPVWHFRYGNSGMALPVWNFRYDTSGMAHRVGHIRYGSSGMELPVWNFLQGTSGHMCTLHSAQTERLVLKSKISVRNLLHSGSGNNFFFFPLFFVFHICLLHSLINQWNLQSRTISLPHSHCSWSYPSNGERQAR